MVMSSDLCLNFSSNQGEGRACLDFCFLLGFQAEQYILSWNLATLE